MSSDTPKELAAVRDARRRAVERELHAEMRRRAPGNTLYWLAVVGGSFVLNLLLLLAIARG
jgi:hypothetical protein